MREVIGRSNFVAAPELATKGEAATLLDFFIRDTVAVDGTFDDAEWWVQQLTSHGRVSRWRQTSGF